MAPRDDHQNLNDLNSSHFPVQEEETEIPDLIIFDTGTTPDDLGNLTHFNILLPYFIEVTIFLYHHPNATFTMFNESSELIEICTSLEDYIFSSGLSYTEKTYCLNILIDSFNTLFPLPVNTEDIQPSGREFLKFFFHFDIIREIVGFGLSEVFTKLINESIISVGDFSIGAIETLLDSLNTNQNLFHHPNNFTEILIFLSLPTNS